jgi:hypothetical protein
VAGEEGHSLLAGMEMGLRAKDDLPVPFRASCSNLEKVFLALLKRFKLNGEIWRR